MSSDESGKREALDRIAEIAVSNGLSADEVTDHLKPVRSDRGERLIRKIFAYLGAIFVLTGVVTAVGLFWNDLGSASRVLVSLGSGLVALVLAIATLRDTRYAAAATPLFLIGSLLQTAGLFVFLDEYSTSSDASLGAMLVFGVMAAQSLLLLMVHRRTDLVFLCLFFASIFLAATLNWLDVDEGLAALNIGVSGTLVSLHIHTTSHRAVTPLSFYVFGACIAFGAFDLIEGRFPLDFMLIGVAAALVYVGVIVQSRSLLVTGVIAMLAYLGYFTDEYFADMLSWPVALIVMGLVMLGLSSYAVKLGRGMQGR